jgi:hypothetical protein
VVEEVRRFFGEVVYDVVIPRTVRLSEAPGFGQPITVYDPRSKGAESYRQLAREVAARPRPDSPMPVFDDLPSVVVQAPSGDAGGTPSDEIPEETQPDAELDPAPTSQMKAVAEPEPAPEPDPQPEPEVAPEPDPEPEPESAPARDAEMTSAPANLGSDPLPAPPAPALEMDPLSERPSEIGWTEEMEAAAEPRVRPPRQVLAPGRLPERRVVVIGEDAEVDIEAAREPLVQVPQRVGQPVDRASDIGETLQDEDAPKRRWRLFRKGGQ